MERNLEMCNIRITSFVSNISVKSIRKVITGIVDGTGDVDHLDELIHKQIKNKHQEKIRQLLDGFITENHKFVFFLLLEEYELLGKQSAMCLQIMEFFCNEPYAQEMKKYESTAITKENKYLIYFRFMIR